MIGKKTVSKLIDGLERLVYWISAILHKIPGTKSAGSAHCRSKSMANMAHHRVQQSQQQTNTFSVGLSAEVNHDGEPLEAAAAAFSPHGHHHGLHSLYSSGFLRKPWKIGRNLPNYLRFTLSVDHVILIGPRMLNLALNIRYLLLLFS